MIIPDKKKVATVILSRMGQNGQEQRTPAKPEDEIGEGDQALKSIADQILLAFENKSSHDLMLGLKAFFDELQESGEEPGPVDSE